jgi:hypothetical protein
VSTSAAFWLNLQLRWDLYHASGLAWHLSRSRVGRTTATLLYLHLVSSLQLLLQSYLKHLKGFARDLQALACFCWLGRMPALPGGMA